MKTPRQAAMDAGEKTYRTTDPCKHGHTAYRYTKSGACSECVNPKSPAWDAPPAQPREQGTMFLGPAVYLVEVLERDLNKVAGMIDRLCSGRFPAIPAAAMQMNLPPAGPGKMSCRLHPYDAEAIQSYAAMLARKK